MLMLRFPQERDTLYIPQDGSDSLALSSSVLFNFILLFYKKYYNSFIYSAHALFLAIKMFNYRYLINRLTNTRLQPDK